MPLRHSVEIATTPDKVWEFFVNLEQNYKAWHPEAHTSFRWTKGRPMEAGSRWSAIEVVHGREFRLRGYVSEVVPEKRIVFKYAFPISLVAPGFKWIIESRGPTTVFTAISYLRAGELFLKIARKHMEQKLAMHDEHVTEEGGNLKKILEQGL
jgi:uncharacterized protein YndB with AHSA1/START domain